jgi:hypothetical protein
MHLGEEHYRRSEESWRDAGRPTAAVSFAMQGALVEMTVRVPVSDIVFTDRTATNPFDNEHPEVNGHAVFVYLTSNGNSGGWAVVPEPDSAHARVRSLSGWGSLRPERAEWSRTSEGFEVRITLAVGDDAAIDVIVNDVVAGRTRRRGQLVLSGGNGEFVYLRGDRHDAASLVPFRLA